MSEQISKAELVAQRRELYARFDTLLASFSEQQLQIPAANGAWSIKDHIAHLTFWERANLLDVLNAIKQGKDWVDPGYETTEEVVEQTNQRVYQQNKDRPVADVLSDFHSTQREVLASLEALSQEKLNTPFEWLGRGSIGKWLSDPEGHYQEHEEYIRNLSTD